METIDTVQDWECGLIKNGKKVLTKGKPSYIKHCSFKDAIASMRKFVDEQIIREEGQDVSVQTENNLRYCGFSVDNRK